MVWPAVKLRLEASGRGGVAGVDGGEAGGGGLDDGHVDDDGVGCAGGVRRRVRWLAS